MSSSRRAWIVATSIGAVEALKDQGFARWNYPLRLLHQHAKANLTKVYNTTHQASKGFSGKSARFVSNKILKEQKLKQSEESLRNVMYLSCWGPN
ncbi:putative serine/threonine-protein kinase RLCKVII-like [Capsicum annuum]|uniref:Wound-responsive family protein n=1 Tax=Capsicum annuum TaxID=4072 RepID=A0A2G3A4N5_CAPAN|nr:putative serine/threonine-protein kinase RLCKVII-like [Capsicum annuum]PHT89163.1 hypothetical protein T459_04276 [Capsicum annuum]